MQTLINIVENMKTSRVSNYVIAGLDSYLVGKDKGNVRLFKNSRNHQDQITPHNHRFDFSCVVLQGTVTNHVWEECTSEEGDLFQITKLKYAGEIGTHTTHPEGTGYYKRVSEVHRTGEIYSMKAEEIHSITFSRGAIVLFFEDVQHTDESIVLEPIVDGEVIPTYEKKEYMFKK